MEAHRLRRIDDLPAIHHGVVRLAGDELGVRSFGLQVLELPAGFADYPEHDHAGDGQEEIYVVLEGSARAEVAGECIDAEAGCMLWVSPESRRRLVAGPYGARILAIGRAPDGAYERPDGFRLAARA